MPPSVVIALIGQIGSGKDFVSDYVTKKHGYQEISMGDIVREETTERNLKLTRENLQKVAREQMDKQGHDYWAKKVVKKINKLKWEKVIVNGVRRIAGVETYRKSFAKKFTLVVIDSDPKIRFKRIFKRSRPGDPKTYEEFQIQEKNELKLYETFEECIILADKKIENNSTAESLFANVDKVIRQIESRK